MLNPNSLHEYFAGYMIDEVSEDGIIDRLRWPLHITVLPWFLTDDIDSVKVKLAEITSKQPKINVTVGSPARFGSKRNIDVNVLEPSMELHAFHSRLVWQIKQLGIEFVDSKFILRSYKPHITHSAKRFIQEGTRLVIDSIDIFEKQDRNAAKRAHLPLTK